LLLQTRLAKRSARGQDQVCPHYPARDQGPRPLVLPVGARGLAARFCGALIPQSGLDVDAGGLAVRAKHMRILNLLQLPDVVQIDVGLKETAIGNVTRDFIELQGLVQLQEAVLAAVKRPPDLVEAADRPAAPAGLVASRQCVQKRKSDRSLAKHPCAVSIM
jgi:hypothetical protein